MELFKECDNLQSKMLSRNEDFVANERIDEVLDMEYLCDNIEFFKSLGEEDKKNEFRTFARLVFELEEQLPNYDTIISDDVSGRLVSIFLREIINKKKKELGKEQVQTYFISGGRHDNEKIYDAIGEFISKKRSSIGRALLVTEFIGSGESINSVVNILEKQNVDFDVASLSVSDYFLEKGKDEEKFNDLTKRLRYGMKNDAGMYFYGGCSTGFKKDIKGDSAHPIGIQDQDFLQKEKNKQARKDMRLMAEEIYKLVS